MVYTIASTGFEKDIKCKNEHENPYAYIKKRLREAIWQAYCEGADEFYVNCEYGIPLWAAEIICGLKKYNRMKLHIVVPYEEQCRDWSEDLRDRYYDVHEQSDSVRFAAYGYTDGCYEKADEIMADSSDKIMVFGEKQYPAYIAGYAEDNDIPVCPVDCLQE